MTKAILFDWHGVLDKITFAGMLETLARVWYLEADGIAFEKYHRMVANNFHKDGLEYAAGRVSPEEFWAGLGAEGEDGAIKAREYILNVERNELLWSQLPALKRKYELVIISDCPKDKRDVIKKTIDLTMFDATYFSCDYGLLKSNPEFFQLALKELGLDAWQCLFIDDSISNIMHASRLGFQTFQYAAGRSLKSLLS